MGFAAFYVKLLLQDDNLSSNGRAKTAAGLVGLAFTVQALTLVFSNEMPIDREASRRIKVAGLIHRCTHAGAVDDEGQPVRYWWSVSDLCHSVSAPSWLPTSEAEFRFYQEFLKALEAGMFDVHGKTRAALLDPMQSTAPRRRGRSFG